MNIKNVMSSAEKVNLTPMIDVVFLLLIFFMVTTSLIKEESDLKIKLPQPSTEVSLVLSEKHIIDILPDGSVHLNGGQIDSGRQTLEIEGLANTLMKLKASSDRMKMKTIIIVQADPFSPHFKAMQVLDACAASDIQYVSFANL